MKKITALLLQILTIIIGIGALAFLLVEPHFEGVNAQAASLKEIYFDDPFLAYAYTASIVFFVAIYQAIKVLGYAGKNQTISLATVKAVRAIRYCGSILVAFAVVAEVYLFLMQPSDDIAGGVFMGLLVIFSSGVIVILAEMFERFVMLALEMKSKKD